MNVYDFLIKQSNVGYDGAYRIKEPARTGAARNFAAVCGKIERRRAEKKASFHFRSAPLGSALPSSAPPPSGQALLSCLRIFLIFYSKLIMQGIPGFAHLGQYLGTGMLVLLNFEPLLHCFPSNTPGLR